MKESKFQPGDLVRHAPPGIDDVAPLLSTIAKYRGPLLLIELCALEAVGRLLGQSPHDGVWYALGPRGMVSVWESNLTLISREEK